MLYLFLQNNSLSKTYYELFIPRMHPKLKGKKLLFFSDTHFRDSNGDTVYDQLITEIENEKPDLILFGGDIIHASAKSMAVEHIKDFFFQVGKVAPTYVIYGNHDLGSKRLNDLNSILKMTGVNLLRNEATWISFGQKSIGFWLMGLSEHERTLKTRSDSLSEIKLPEGSKNEPKILLAHYPQYFNQYLTDDNKRPDLTLSGHAHGGQVILPLIGGVFAPGQGFNPTYDFGLYTNEKYPSSRLILTRGIGNSTFPYRINNRPELVVIKFQ